MPQRGGVALSPIRSTRLSYFLRHSLMVGAGAVTAEVGRRGRVRGGRGGDGRGGPAPGERGPFELWRGGDLESPSPGDPPPISLARRMVFKRPPGDAAAGRCRRCGCRSRRVCGFGGCGRQSCSFRMCAPSNGEGFSSVTALTLLTLSRVCHRCLIRGGLHRLLPRVGVLLLCTSILDVFDIRVM